MFDLLQIGYREWVWVFAPLGFVAVGWLAIALSNRLPPKVSKKDVTVFGWMFIVFASLAAVSTLAATYADYTGLASAVRGGRTRVVVGSVRDYESRKNGYERYKVGAVEFEYSDDQVMAGFNNTASRGGPIHEGLRVRITYAQGVPWTQSENGRSIVRLQIAR